MKAGAEGSRRDAETRREMQKHVWHAQRLCDGRGGAHASPRFELCQTLPCSDRFEPEASALRLMDRIRPRYTYSSDFK